MGCFQMWIIYRRDVQSVAGLIQIYTSKINSMGTLGLSKNQVYDFFIVFG